MSDTFNESERPADNPFAAPEVMEEVSTLSSSFDFAPLQKTGKGLMLIYFALLLLVLIIIGSMFLMFSVRTATVGSIGITAPLAIFLVGTLLFTVLNLIGAWMCTSVPPESGARGLAMISFILAATQAVMAMVSRFAGLFLASWVGQLAGLATLIVFVFFMRRLSTYIQRSDLVARTTRLFIVAGVLLSCGIVLYVVPFNGQQASVFMLLSAFVGLGSLVLFVMYANLVNALSKAIRRPDQSPATNHF